MKKYITLLISFVFCSTLFAQEKMILHKTDNSTVEIPVEEIDYLSFSEDELNLQIIKTDNNNSDIPVAEIDSITFYEENVVQIAYSGNSASITNPFAGKGIEIAQEGNDIVVTSTVTDTEVKYILSGTASDGMFKIYSDYKFELVLNGVSITNNDGAAINIQSGKKVTVTLAEGTNNYLTDGSAYNEPEDEDMKSTLFSEGQLNFEGKGSLFVQGNYKHAICSDDYIRIKDGNITVTGAVKDGIHMNDYFMMDGGNLTVTASSDGIECEKGYIRINDGTINVTAVDDGIKASYKSTDLDRSIEINGGSIGITTTTGEKGTAIKGKGDITVNNGTFNLNVNTTAGKGFNCDGNLTVNDGDITITSTGNAFYDTSDADISSSCGIKCDGDMLIDKGNITITSSGSGGKGISADGTLTMNNATINVSTTGEQFVYGGDDTAAKAIKSDGNLTVNGGSVIINTTGVEAEGLESKATLVINGGNVEIEAYDDCINATDHIEINGGNVYCNSTVNDGIDSNGTLTITGGVVISAGARAPEGGFDCDNNTFKITGGTIIGIGGSTSNPTANVSTQRSVVYSARNNTSPQIIYIESADGDTILTFKAPKTYNQGFAFLFSSPDMAASTTYSIYTGGSISGGTDFHGIYSDAEYTKGTSAATFTTNNMVTTVGSGGGPGPGGPF